eukprot:147417_1
MDPAATISGATNSTILRILHDKTIGMHCWWSLTLLSFISKYSRNPITIHAIKNIKPQPTIPATTPAALDSLTASNITQQPTQQISKSKVKCRIGPVSKKSVILNDTYSLPPLISQSWLVAMYKAMVSGANKTPKVINPTQHT